MRQSWKGPGRTGQSFVYFAKKICHQFPETSATGGYFVKAYQIFETPSSCLGAGQNFVRGEIRRICQFTCHDYDDLKENVNQENLISIFSRSIWCLFWCDWHLWLTNILLCLRLSVFPRLKI